MKKYFIEECKCGISRGGVACGPVGGAVIAAAKYTVDGNTKWLTNVEFDGFPGFYLTEESIFEKVVEDDLDEEELTNSFIEEFDGVALKGDYDEIVNSMKKNEENPANALIKFLIALTCCEEDQVETLINIGTGEYAEEIVVQE